MTKLLTFDFREMTQEEADLLMEKMGCETMNEMKARVEAMDELYRTKNDIRRADLRPMLWLVARQKWPEITYEAAGKLPISALSDLITPVPAKAPKASKAATR